jgi:hypothetical protein
MTKILQIIPVLLWLLAVLTGVKPLKFSRLTTILIAFAAAIAFSKFSFFKVVGGSVTSPDLPPAVIWGFGWLYGAAVAFTVLSIAFSLLDGVFLIRRRPISLHSKRIRVLLFVIVSVAISLYGIYEGVRVPSVKRVELSLESLPAEFDGYRIVHISDLHCSTSIRRERIASIVEKVNALDADLVAITGDFVDGRVADRRGDMAPLADLRAKDGVVGCSGNHEFYWEWDKWLKELSGMGIEFPEISGPRTIGRGTAVMSVGALADPAIAGVRHASSAFVGAPYGAFKVLLFHRPITEVIDAEGAGVDLQLSGHTHGGAMPVLRWLVEKVNEGRSRGIYTFGERGVLYNSSGSGQWAGFPLRLLTPSEIAEIVLRRKTETTKEE